MTLPVVFLGRKAEIQHTCMRCCVTRTIVLALESKDPFVNVNVYRSPPMQSRMSPPGLNHETSQAAS